MNLKPSPSIILQINKISYYPEILCYPRNIEIKQRGKRIFLILTRKNEGILFEKKRRRKKLDE